MGTNAVYFQPPATVKMTYPCIRYKLSNGNAQFADDEKYIYRKRYQLTLIDANPDTVYLDEILKLPLCSLDTTFISENLNHFVFTIYW